LWKEGPINHRELGWGGKSEELRGNPKTGGSTDGKKKNEKWDRRLQHRDVRRETKNPLCEKLKALSG